MSKQLTNEDYNTLLKIQQQNGTAMGELTGIAIKTYDEVVSLQKDTRKNASDIEQLKFNAEITDEQSSVLQDLVKIKVRELVGYPSPYYRKVISDLYKNLKKHHHMGSKIATTKKGNFKSVVEGIRLYNPDIKKLKATHDIYLEEQRKYDERLKRCMEEVNEYY